MERRKVAYLTPLYFDEASCLGGGERYPLNLARGVVAGSEGRYTVELISFGDAPRQLTLAQGVTLCVLPVAHRPTKAVDVVSWDLPQALADADLVHIHQAYTRCSEVGLLVAKQQRKPVCITDHGGYSSPLGLEVGSLDLADRIIAYSDFGASLYPKTRTPIIVIKGGVDADLFTPPAEPQTRDRVLFVGRLLPHKGIDRLIHALPPDLPLTVCGRPYRDDYFRHLVAISSGKQVEFITDADDDAIRRLYWKSWANVLSSVYQDCYGVIYREPELMGFTLLEAMACGTPAVASRVAAMPEFIQDGQTGYVYDTPEQLAEQLRRLSENLELVEQIGCNARAAVEREFDLKVAGARFLAVYEELIAKAGEMAA